MPGNYGLKVLMRSIPSLCRCVTWSPSTGERVPESLESSGESQVSVTVSKGREEEEEKKSIGKYLDIQKRLFEKSGPNLSCSSLWEKASHKWLIMNLNPESHCASHFFLKDFISFWLLVLLEQSGHAHPPLRTFAHGSILNLLSAKKCTHLLLYLGF